MRHLVREAGLEHAIRVDSAGTAGYHAGDPPDFRACAAGERRGIAIGGCARKFEPEDFQRFDYVLAMDRTNFEDLAATAPNAQAKQKLFLLRSFDPKSPPGASVPDPYYGSEDGFDLVLELCLAACKPLLEKVRREHGL